MPKKKNPEPSSVKREMYSGSEQNERDLQEWWDSMNKEEKRMAEEAKKPKTPPYKPLDPKDPFDKSIMGLERHIRKWEKFQGMYGNKSGSVGGGGMNPADVEKVPGKRPLKMAKGGLATRGYGLARRPVKKVVKLAVTKKR